MAESHLGVDSIAAPPTDSLREVLRRTMVMGMPVEDAFKPTFYFDRTVTWEDFDSENQPWDWESVPVTEEELTSVQVVCAYEFFSPLGRQGSFYTEVGEFNPTTLVFTMFEDEWETVRGFSYATVGPPRVEASGPTKWFFRFWRPAYGLGDMTVFQVHTAAEGIS
jgi:hypothetical protein